MYPVSNFFSSLGNEAHTHTFRHDARDTRHVTNVNGECIFLSLILWRFIHVPKYSHKHTLTMKDAGRNGYCTQHKEAFRQSTDLSDVNAIPTKEKQQKEVKNLLNLLSMLLMRTIFLSAKVTVIVQGNG